MLVLLLAWPARAQGVLGTDSVQFERLRIQGRLFGCSLGYGALIKDHVHEKGGYDVVRGNIAITSAKRNIAMSVKIILIDMKPIASGWSHIPVRPYFAYLQTKDGKNNISSFVRKEASDIPGALLVVYKFDDNFTRIMKDIAANKSTTIVYSRTKGGVDVPVKLDLTIRQTRPDGRRERSTSMVDGFLNCFREVAKAAQKN